MTVPVIRAKVIKIASSFLLKFKHRRKQLESNYEADLMKVAMAALQERAVVTGHYDKNGNLIIKKL